ncbi:hypothetical protein GF402_00680 [Candidatus Fermentibacteria bacterium]|nr:hypothetical protein [Candidatus Fermentibacteria bacterium]
MIPLAAAALVSLLLEELLQRHYHIRPEGITWRFDPEAPEAVKHKYRSSVHKAGLLRVLQLLFVGSMFSVSAQKLGQTFFSSGLGQLVGLLLLLQVVRMMGNRLLGHWFVTATLMWLQVVLIPVTILLYASTPDLVATAETELLLWAAGITVLLGNLALSVSFSFAVAFVLRLRLNRRHDLFGRLPPLAGSESWVRRTGFVALILFGVSAACMIVPAVGSGTGALTLLLEGSLLVLLGTAQYIFRLVPKSYHTPANVLTGLAFVAVILLTALEGAFFG